MLRDILPGNTTVWEGALADALDTSSVVAPSIDLIRGTKLVAPPPTFLPFLVHEYGLGELTPYVPNLYDLIAEGIDWQRVRGTPSALALALAWLEYSAALEEEGSLRRFWNLFQIELDRVRDADADLERVGGVAQLSAPKRSVFWRGFHGLDTRPLTYSKSHWGESHYGEYSGRRLRQGGPLWSFGRQYEFDLTLGKTDLQALGVYIEPVDTSVTDFGIDAGWVERPVAAFEETPPSSLDLGWGDFAWNSTEAAWDSGIFRARSEAMASAVLGRPVWVVFLDVDDEVIGYRRARALHTVVAANGGPYVVSGISYATKTEPDTSVYVECQTGFGDGAGQLAAKVGLVLDGTPVGRPGQLWLGPDELTGGTEPSVVSEINIAFGLTVRERVKFLLRF